MLWLLVSVDFAAGGNNDLRARFRECCDGSGLVDTLLRVLPPRFEKARTLRALTQLGSHDRRKLLPKPTQESQLRMIAT